MRSAVHLPRALVSHLHLQQLYDLAQSPKAGEIALAQHVPCFAAEQRASKMMWFAGALLMSAVATMRVESAHGGAAM
jgi:hypothetical protein